MTTHKPIGLSFPAELQAAGLLGLPFAWSSGGDISFDTSMTKSQIDAVNAVYADHDPNGSLTWRRNQAVITLRAARDAAMDAGMSYAINGTTYVFQTDLTSRVLINGSAQAILSSATPPTGYYLRTNDTPNVNVPVTADQMQAFQVALTNQAAAIRALYNTYKTQILASSNPESVTYTFATLVGVTDGTILPTPTMNVPNTVIATATTATQAATVAATATSTASAAMTKANTALQPGDVSTAGKTGKFTDLTGKPVVMSTTVNATTSIGTITLTGYAAVPTVEPVATWNGNQLYLAEIMSVTTTLITVKAHRSKGTLLLSDGPFELGPGIVVSVKVSA